MTAWVIKLLLQQYVQSAWQRRYIKLTVHKAIYASANPAPKHGGMLKVRNKFLFQLFRPLTFVVFLGIFDGITMLLATASSELR